MKKNFLELVLLASTLCLVACGKGGTSSSNSKDSSSVSPSETSSKDSGASSATSNSSSSTSSSSSSSSSSEAPSQFKVTFKNADGTSLYSTVVKTGEYATYVGDTPIKNDDDQYAYSFDGWDKDPKTTAIDADTTFTATYAHYSIGSTGVVLTKDTKENEYKITDFTGKDTDVVLPAYHNGIPVTSVGDYLFSNGDITSIVFPSTIRTLGKYDCRNCIHLTKVDLGSGLEEIGEESFAYCDILTSISFPDSLETIGDYVLSDCAKLASVEIGTGVKSIGREFMAESPYCSDTANKDGIGVYLKTRGTTAHYYLISAVASSEAGTTLTLKQGTIGTSNNCSTFVELTSLTFNSDLEYLGDEFLSGMTKLTSVTLPSSIKSLGDCPFNYSTGLATIDLSSCSSITSIPESAFGGCSALTKVLLPSSLTSIEDSAFEGCSALQTIDLPSSITTLGQYVFYQSGLTQFTWPANITKIPDYSFFKCGSLTSFTIPSSVTEIGDAAFFTCPKLASVTLSSSLVKIDGSAFTSCTSLTSIKYDGLKSLESVGYEAFESTGYEKAHAVSGSPTYLESETCDDKIIISGSSAIGDCVIKEGTVVISDNALRSCGITSLSLPNSLRPFPAETISQNSKMASISVGSENKYMSAANNILFNKDKTLVIAAAVNNDSFVIPASVTEIGSLSFQDSSASSITFEAGSKLTKIDTSAFAYSKNITSFILPDSVTVIEGRAFSSCSSLTTFTISQNSLLTSMGEFEFDLTSLERLYIPSHFTSMGQLAFYRIKKNVRILLDKNATTAKWDSNWNKIEDTTYSVKTYNEGTKAGEWMWVEGVPTIIVAIPQF